MAGSRCLTPPAERDPVAAALEAVLSPGIAPRRVPERVFVAFSGGLDSTVLLHAAARHPAVASRQVTLTAVHVNHGLSPRASAWEARCAAAAAALNVGFRVRRAQVAPGGGLETRARAARYPHFAELLAEPGDRLLLAHHRNDQIETVLLRLLQGRGGYGMPGARPLGRGLLVRPLLDLSRQTLADYARRHGLSWIEDPANADLSIPRNRVRHVLLPALRRSGSTDETLLAIGAASVDADRRLADQYDIAGNGSSLAVQALCELSAAEAPALLRVWLAGAGRRAPPRRALADFVRQLRESRADRQPRLTVDGGSLAVFAGRVHLVPPPPVLASAYALDPPGTLNLPHGELAAHADARGVQPRGAVRVGFRAGGERLSTSAGRRRVKDLLREAGVPPWQRDGWPLVFDDAGLLALPGIATRHPAAPGGAAAGGYLFRWKSHR